MHAILLLDKSRTVRIFVNQFFTLSRENKGEVQAFFSQSNGTQVCVCLVSRKIATEATSGRFVFPWRSASLTLVAPRYRLSLSARATL